MRKRDWKGIAALITALVGAGGFLWNLLDHQDAETENELMHESMYGALEQRLDDVYRLTERCVQRLDRINQRIDNVVFRSRRRSAAPLPPDDDDEEVLVEVLPSYSELKQHVQHAAKPWRIDDALADEMAGPDSSAGAEVGRDHP